MILKAVAVGVICAVTVSIVEKIDRDLAKAVSLAGLAVILLSILPGIGEIVSFAKEGADSVGKHEYLEYVMKVLGVVLVAEIASEVFEQAGNGGVSRAVTSAAAVEAVVIALPLLRELLSFASSLLR